MRAWVSAHPMCIDLVGAAALLVLLSPIGLLTDGNTGSLGPWQTIAISVFFIVPLGFRRTHPVASAVAIYSAGLFLLVIAQWQLTPATLTVPIALYSVTLYGPRWAYRTALLGSFVGMTWLALGLFFEHAQFYLGRPEARVIIGVLFALFFAYMFMLTVWAFALMRRSRRDAMAALVDRAARLEVERDQQHQLATSAERTRIAREMHDIVAHSLSVIIAQADGGRYAARQDAGVAERVLGTISETGRDALADMRRLLGVLRPDVESGAPAPPPAYPGTRAATPLTNPTMAFSAGPSPRPGHSGFGTGDAGAPQTETTSARDSGAGHAWRGSAAQSDTPETKALAAVIPPANLAPKPSSGDLDALIDQVRASGLRISLVRLGTPRPLPPGVGLTVFRICQESLTNVLKHAGPDPTVTIVLRWDAALLSLDVSDDGRGAAADSDGMGQGVRGMGERATMFGGTLTSGPRTGGGFRVHLELPIPALAPEPAQPRAFAVTLDIPVFAGPLDPPELTTPERGNNL